MRFCRDVKRSREHMPLFSQILIRSSIMFLSTPSWQCLMNLILMTSSKKMQIYLLPWRVRLQSCTTFTSYQSLISLMSRVILAMRALQISYSIDSLSFSSSQMYSAFDKVDSVFGFNFSIISSRFSWIVSMMYFLTKPVLRRQDITSFCRIYSKILGPNLRFCKSWAARISIFFQNYQLSNQNPRQSERLSSCIKENQSINSQDLFTILSRSSQGAFLASFRLGRTPASCSMLALCMFAVIPFSSFYIQPKPPFFVLEQVRQSLIHQSNSSSSSRRIFSTQLYIYSQYSNCPIANTISTIKGISSLLL